VKEKRENILIIRKKEKVIICQWGARENGGVNLLLFIKEKDARRGRERVDALGQKKKNSFTRVAESSGGINSLTNHLLYEGDRGAVTIILRVKIRQRRKIPAIYLSPGWETTCQSDL